MQVDMGAPPRFVSRIFPFRLTDPVDQQKRRLPLWEAALFC
jgi:hypothetical protein